MNVNLVREAMAANLESIAGIQARPYALTNPTAPSAQIVPGPGVYHLAMQDGDESRVFNVQVFVAALSDVGAQKRFGEFLAEGALSIKAALEQTESDGHTPKGMPDGVYDVTVVSDEGQQEFTSPDGSAFYGTTFTVNVRA